MQSSLAVQSSNGTDFRLTGLDTVRRGVVPLSFGHTNGSGGPHEFVSRVAAVGSDVQARVQAVRTVVRTTAVVRLRLLCTCHL